MSIKPCTKRFHFTNPETKQKERGTVHKEELVRYSESEYRDYHTVAQLLKYDDDGWFIRLGYYLKDHGAKDNGWRWGSQTATIISVESVDKLIKSLTSLKAEYEKKKTWTKIEKREI